MRLWRVFLKTVTELRREPLLVGLTLAFAPFFVFVYWLAWGEGGTTYTVLVVNRDAPLVAEGQRVAGGEAVLQALHEVKALASPPAASPTAATRSLLKVTVVRDELAAQAHLRDRSAAALLVIPEGFSADLAERKPAKVVMVGDLTSPAYSVAAVLTMTAVDATVRRLTGVASPYELDERALGGSGTRTDFEVSVPGIMVFSVIMLVFLAAMTVARETESGTLRRLQLTRMTSLDLLGGTSAALVLVGLGSVLLTFVTARALGFESKGPVWLAVVVGAGTSVAVIGVGLVVAAFSRSVTQAFVLANFPMGLLMFFSGAMFPVPRLTLFSIAGHPVGAFDVLPPTHAVVALNKVLTFGAGLGDIAFELGALMALSALYFAIGVVLFRRRLGAAAS